MSLASVTSTRRTRWPLMSMPRMAWAFSAVSSGDSASLTPPALPRPPVFTCALTTTRPPICSAAARACSTVSATTPGSTGTPCAAKSSFAWYSIRSTLRPSSVSPALDRSVEPKPYAGSAARGRAYPGPARPSMARSTPRPPESQLGESLTMEDRNKDAARRARSAGLGAQLKPDGLDAEPVLLRDRIVDDRADALAVHEAVDDVDRSQDVRQPHVAALAQGVLAAEVDRDDAHAQAIAQVAAI